MFVITAAAICRSMISVHPVEQMYPSIKDHVHVQPFLQRWIGESGSTGSYGCDQQLTAEPEIQQNNIEARNLLGLVYFETGEVVAALSEWVISKNMRPEKNIADDYINMLQSNATRLDAINQTIKNIIRHWSIAIRTAKTWPSSS